MRIDCQSEGRTGRVRARTNVLSFLRGGLVENYINHTLLVGITWVRLIAFIFFLGVLFGLRDKLPGWQSLVWLTIALGLYSIAVAVLLRSRQDRIARWVGGSFDILTIIIAIFLLVVSGAPGDISHTLTKIGIFLVIPLSMVQFGVFVGVGVSLGIVCLYLLMHGLVVGAPQAGMVMLGAPTMVVVGGLVASLSNNLRSEQRQVVQSSNRMLPLPSAGGYALERVHEVALPVESPKPLPKSEKVKLYIAEEQYILRKAYESFFPLDSGIEVVGVSGENTGEDLARAAEGLKPDVMLLGFKVLQPDAVEKLEMIREGSPDVAIVVLSGYYNVRGVKALRDFSRDSSTACAFLLKHTVDTVEQLAQVIRLVAEGRVILDPAVMEGLTEDSDSEASLLKELSPAELAILKWMANGYRDETIGKVLHLEPQKLQRHINSIYEKLGDGVDAMDPRTHAITFYLKATGMLISKD